MGRGHCDTVRGLPHSLCHKWHIMFCCKSATAIAQDCVSLPLLILGNLVTFYHATQCISAVLLSSGVRPSVTFAYCIQTAEDLVKLLSRPGSHIILIFWPYAPVLNSKGNPFSGANTSEVEKFAIFDWNRRLSRKRYEIGPLLLWNFNRKS